VLLADVFPDEESIAAAGWHSQAESDLLSVLGPRHVGIPANNIARFKARRTVASGVTGKRPPTPPAGSSSLDPPPPPPRRAWWSPAPNRAVTDYTARR
jgi:protein gp88